MAVKGMTVGKLSRTSGVSVRALHHYDEIGLLTPTARSESGYRLYGQRDIERLQQIRSLQALGMSLDQIGVALDDPGHDLGGVLRLQLDAIDARIEQLSQLRSRLSDLVALMNHRQTVASDDLLALMKEMHKVEKYYTQEQLDELAKRREALGDEGMRQAEAQWATLIDRVREARNAGLDPGSPKVRELADEWQSLVQAFTGGDPGISQSLNRVWQEEDEVAGFDTAEMRELSEFLHGARSQ
jgi:DNA-binding transcriptional MerR regulator